MRFILNDEAKTVHADPPKAECNVPTARAEGEKGTEYASMKAAALCIWELGWSACHHCFEDEADSPKGDEGGS